MAEIGIGLIGAGWMGKVHAMAYRNVPMAFGSEPAVPRLEVVADIDEDGARAVAGSFGFARWTTDWREVVADPQVDAVDITAPNDLHPEIAIAACRAGKAVYCEKPLALTAAGSREMAAAAREAGVATMVGFNYLKNPAQGFARQLIEAGEIGDVIQFRGTFDVDHMTDPNTPFTWRTEKALAGSGALGDQASHTMSFSQYLVGDIEEVCGMTGTFVTERPVAGGGEMRRVENDDVVMVLVRYANGGMGCIEASRVATGRKLWASYEIQGTKGALFFTQERMNELQLYRHGDPPAERGYKTIYTGPEHPNYAAFQPLPGVGLGYNEQKIIEARDFIVAVAEGGRAEPDFDFGHRISRVIDAVLLSVDERRWVRIDEIE